jgi:hypothetical protein
VQKGNILSRNYFPLIDAGSFLKRLCLRQKISLRQRLHKLSKFKAAMTNY